MEWSSNSAYIIGLITTDGSLSKDGRHIDFTSKDLDQIQNFQKILALSNKIGIKRSGVNNTTSYFRIQFGNIAFYKFLVSIGLHPNKTKTLQKLLIPDTYFADFLRGYFDGDGFSYSYWDKRWKSSFLFYIGFVSASKAHLVWIKEKIYTLYGLCGALKNSGKSTYHLMYAKSNSQSLVKIMYPNDRVICLKRKRLKIQDALDIINNHAEVAKLVNAQS